MKIPDWEHNLLQVQILCSTGFWGAAGVSELPLLCKVSSLPFMLWDILSPCGFTKSQDHHRAGAHRGDKKFLSLWFIPVWGRKGSQGIGLGGNSLGFTKEFAFFVSCLHLRFLIHNLAYLPAQAPQPHPISGTSHQFPELVSFSWQCRALSAFAGFALSVGLFLLLLSR